MGNDPDQELLSEWLSDDKARASAAFSKVYEKYQSRIYNLALRITGDHGAAGDVVQETFVTVFAKIRGFRGHSLFSSWLTRIGINYALERKRKDNKQITLMKRNPESDPGSEATEVEDEKGRTPEASTAGQELEMTVQKVIDRLDDRYKTVVLLRYMEAMSYEQIAETCECSVGTVKSRLNRAHRTLEGSLGPLAKELGLRPEPADPAEPI